MTSAFTSVLWKTDAAPRLALRPSEESSADAEVVKILGIPGLTETLHEFRCW